jgi:hypothetical protein
VILRLTAVAAGVIAAPAAAHAQFAGVVPPPPTRAAVVAATPGQQAAVRDSVRRESMSDMRAWVDSAAGVVTVTPRTPDAPGRDPAAAPDSTRARPAPPPPAPPRD